MSSTTAFSSISSDGIIQANFHQSVHLYTHQNIPRRRHYHGWPVNKRPLGNAIEFTPYRRIISKRRDFKA